MINPKQYLEKQNLLRETTGDKNVGSYKIWTHTLYDLLDFHKHLGPVGFSATTLFQSIKPNNILYVGECRVIFSLIFSATVRAYFQYLIYKWWNWIYIIIYYYLNSETVK